MPAATTASATANWWLARATRTAGPSSSSQSGGGSGELAAELAASLTVRVEDLDLPVVPTAESAELRSSPREYLEVFSIRG